MIYKHRFPHHSDLFSLSVIFRDIQTYTIDRLITNVIVIKLYDIFSPIFYFHEYPIFFFI